MASQFSNIKILRRGAFLERAKNSIPPVGALIPDGPVSRGFDYFHGFHHSRDMDAVIENGEGD
jgi:hypothetical protein